MSAEGEKRGKAWVLFIIPDRPDRDLWKTREKKLSKNGTTSSDQTGPTKRNDSHHFLFISRIPYISEIYRRDVEQRISLS